MKKILAVFLVLILLISCVSPLLAAENSQQPSKKVLVVYEKRFYWWSKEDIAKAFDLLLHHFPVETTLVHSRDYWSGMSNQFDAVVYLPMEIHARPPKDLMKDMAKGDKLFLWVGRNLDKYLAYSPQTGLEVSGQSSDFLEMEYGGRTLLDTRKIKTPLLKVDSQNVKVLARQKCGNQVYPLAIQKDKFMYIDRLDFRQADAVITADLLHNFLGEDHPVNHEAYIRIEDVHPLRDQQKLKTIADHLAERKVPFMIALIPVYTNGEGQLVKMSDQPGFADTIKYMTARGGSVVLHGYTHQTGKEETAQGFEFWDRKKDIPLAGNNQEYTQERLELALQECLKNGIAPLAFEPPHYGMSEEGYKYLRQTVSTLSTAVQTSDKGFSTTTFPVAIGPNPYMSSILPENLSYIDTNLADPVAPLLSKSKDLLAVRDGMAGGFFHPYLDIKYLDQLVDGLKAQGYTFLDLKMGTHQIKTKDFSIKAEAGQVSFTQGKGEIPTSSLWETLSQVPWDNVARILQIALMLLAVFHSRRTDSKRYL